MNEYYIELNEILNECVMLGEIPEIEPDRIALFCGMIFKNDGWDLTVSTGQYRLSVFGEIVEPTNAQIENGNRTIRIGFVFKQGKEVIDRQVIFVDLIFKVQR